MTTTFRKAAQLALYIGFALILAISLSTDTFSRGGGGKGGGKGGGHGGGNTNRGGSFHGGKPSGKQPVYKHNNNNNKKHHHHYEYDHWHRHNNYYGRWTGAAIGTVALGTVAYSLPTSCVKVVRSKVAYKRCGNVWYAPRYQGSNIVYIAVRAP
jgi:hypothetical protein